MRRWLRARYPRPWRRSFHPAGPSAPGTIPSRSGAFILDDLQNPIGRNHLGGRGQQGNDARLVHRVGGKVSPVFSAACCSRTAVKTSNFSVSSDRLQAAISARVRWHPAQTSASSSNWQTPIHGDSTLIFQGVPSRESPNEPGPHWRGWKRSEWQSGAGNAARR